MKKLPKIFTVTKKQTIDGQTYNVGDYALKKKRAGGGVYLNMDNGEMLGVDSDNISKLTENFEKGGKVKFDDSPMIRKLWNERGYDIPYLESLSNAELKGIYETEFDDERTYNFETDTDEIPNEYAKGGDIRKGGKVLKILKDKKFIKQTPRENGWYIEYYPNEDKMKDRRGTGIGYDADEDTYWHNSVSGYRLNSDWNHKRKNNDKGIGWYSFDEDEILEIIDGVGSFFDKDDERKWRKYAKGGPIKRGSGARMSIDFIKETRKVGDFVRVETDILGKEELTGEIESFSPLKIKNRCNISCSNS